MSNENDEIDTFLMLMLAGFFFALFTNSGSSWISFSDITIVFFFEYF